MAEAKSTIQKYHFGVGRRKTAVARVRLYPNGTGACVVNTKATPAEGMLYIEPLKLVGRYGTTDLTVTVSGGGFQAQAVAIRHAVSRALVELDETYKATLKRAGYLTRDPRERERKKFGLKSARRSPQWSKR